MKIFISQPMSGRTEEEILKERAMAIHDLKGMYGDKVEFLYSYFPDPEPALRLLGRALEVMADADMAIFIDGWRNSRGCRIEYLCAGEYGIKTAELIYMRQYPCVYDPEYTIDDVIKGGYYED